MELKFKEVNDTYKVIENGIKIKSFLTIEEINDIVNSMLETENEVERYMIKICKTTEYCTNLDLSGFMKDKVMSGEGVFNLVAEIGISDTYEETIYNYYIIDKLVKNSESPYLLLKTLINIFDNKMKEFDISKLQKEFLNIKKLIK